MVKKTIISLIKGYQLLLSPILPPACRFYPSCSEYGYQAFIKYYWPKAVVLTTWRILRCNPFNKGGFDPLK